MAEINSPAPTPAAQGPNCWQCQYFGITHIPQTPYLCRGLGFQSKRMPALDVLHIDGRFCASFKAKSALVTRPA